jgi:hypothetical protein
MTKSDESREPEGDGTDDTVGDATKGEGRLASWRAALPRSAWRPVLTVALVGLLLVSCLLAVFTSKDPQDIRIGVVGQQALVDGFTDAVGSSAGDAFEIEVVERDDVETLVAEREIYAAVLLFPEQLEVVYAGANGSIVNNLVLTAFKIGGKPPARTEDVVPFVSDDANGLAVPYSVLGVTVTGLLLGLVLLWPAGRASARPEDELDEAASSGPRPVKQTAVPLLVASLVVGVLGALLLNVAYDVLPGSFVVTVVLLTGLMFATSGLTTVLGRLLGLPGVLAAAVVLVGLGVATAGSPLPTEVMPSSLRWLSAVLPLGPTVDGLIGESYFRGAGVDRAIATLVLWAVAVLVALAGVERLGHRLPGRRATADAA